VYSRTTLFVAIFNCQITCCRLSSSHRIGSAGIAADWHNYAIIVGLRTRPAWRTDPDSVRDAAVDGLIAAVRYYDPDRGCRTIQSWIVWCVTTRVKQRPYRSAMQQHTQMMPPGHDAIAPRELSPIEAREFS